MNRLIIALLVLLIAVPANAAPTVEDLRRRNLTLKRRIKTCKKNCQGQPTPTATPETPETDPTVCTVKSWSGGALWKPESESTGSPVMLLPDDSFYKCTVQRVTGGVDNLREGEIANGGRRHWWADARCNSYKGRARVRCKRTDGTCMERFLDSDPCQRLE